MTKRFGHGTCKFGHGTLFYDQIELVTEAPSHLVYHDQLVIFVIEVELFHDQHVFRHRSVFLL
jgi:hypothetical protein